MLPRQLVLIIIQRGATRVLCARRIRRGRRMKEGEHVVKLLRPVEDAMSDGQPRRLTKAELTPAQVPRDFFPPADCLFSRRYEPLRG